MSVAEGARPRGQRLPRSARRAQLLEAAQAAFVESGYHAAAMDDIAERAGVSKPVLYQHFPGKLDLYLALLDQTRQEIEQAVRGALTGTTDNRQRVLDCMAVYFDVVSRESAPFRLIFESDLSNDPAVAERIEGVATTCGDALAEVIAADTEMSDADAHLLGMALTGMAQVAARYWLSQGASVPRDEAARLVGQLAWRGIGGFPKVGGPGAEQDPAS
ncbi:TetR/AcrR family transcriptional regulator [Lapillicoccus jejuensis]|uniref:TetR family transcriptional regulator n=1 Tax=Lapillicoccus jejuensis TaxID=402171 RepID=A0A542DW70_9MICO|nr:TetR/AcrR family transcriptional regulator [Lapillicoccus jejuensis]TQJ07333.1 TetR family transcriptional regulator [Lapillicoccus jejuensis]